MDCVGCQKCRLWGKIQTFGLGTALKILYTFGDVEEIRLNRQEVVALLNTFHRFAESVALAKEFENTISMERKFGTVMYGTYKYYIGIGIVIIGMVNMIFGKKKEQPVQKKED
jgi:hypothetical protein